MTFWYSFNFSSGYCTWQMLILLADRWQLPFYETFTLSFIYCSWCAWLGTMYLRCRNICLVLLSDVFLYLLPAHFQKCFGTFTVALCCVLLSNSARGRIPGRRSLSINATSYAANGPLMTLFVSGYPFSLSDHHLYCCFQKYLFLLMLTLNSFHSKVYFAHTVGLDGFNHISNKWIFVFLYSSLEVSAVSGKDVGP